MNQEYLQKLNKDQREAVEYTDGPSIILAGAGSGKTRVLTNKVLHLIHAKKLMQIE
jgi:DNA helicase-2/ATP-dependent DNA helicase PcrA